MVTFFKLFFPSLKESVANARLTTDQNRTDKITTAQLTTDKITTDKITTARLTIDKITTAWNDDMLIHWNKTSPSSTKKINCST